MGYESKKDEKFDSIYRAYVGEVYKATLHYTKDEYVAQEITQKAFYQFFLHYDNVNIDSVRAYLLRIARNLVYNRTRDMKRVTYEERLEDLQGDNIFTLSVEETYLRDEQKKQAKGLSKSILEHLRQENELWYEAMLLVYCLEKPQEQVADELGISKDVLYSRLYRARKWIRKNYGKEYEEFVKGS